MPSDHQRSSKSSFLSKKAKQPIKRCGVERSSSSSFLSTPSVSNSDAEERKLPQYKRQKPFMIWEKKVRVICTDPDATDSSSDEEEGMVLPKRLVREILIPSHCCAFPRMAESTGDGICGGKNGCGSDRSFLPARKEECCMSGAIEENSVSVKKNTERENLPSMPGCVKKTGKKVNNAHKVSASRRTGEVHRQRGKWTAEICDPWKGIRLWLGPSLDEAAKPSNKINARLLFQEESLPKLDQSADPDPNPSLTGNSSLLTSPHHLPPGSNAGSGSFLDCPNGEEFGFAGSSFCEQLVEPFSSCYSDFGSLSPSSVLENSSSDDCGSPNLLNVDQKLSCCADAYFDKSPIDAISSLSDLITSDMVVCKDAKFGHVTTTTTTTTTTTNIGGLMLSQIKLESLANPAFNLLSSTTSHPLLEESQYYSDLSQIFNTGRVDCEPFDHLDTKLFADDGGFCEMDFDMETETLAWINVAEV